MPPIPLFRRYTRNERPSSWYGFNFARSLKSDRQCVVEETCGILGLILPWRLRLQNLIWLDLSAHVLVFHEFPDEVLFWQKWEDYSSLCYEECISSFLNLLDHFWHFRTSSFRLLWSEREFCWKLLRFPTSSQSDRRWRYFSMGVSYIQSQIQAL